MHTTCVATRLDAGHANNALPQMARANVNCRILPGHSAEEIRATLVKIVDDPKIAVTLSTGGLGGGANPPSPLRPDLMGTLEKVSSEMWPGVPVVPVMETGASDGAYSRAAGIPTYGISGMWMDPNEDRSHGQRRAASRLVLLRGRGFLSAIRGGAQFGPLGSARETIQ